MPCADKITKEFPDFPLDSLPEGIPPWLEPCPWHNDSCPLWGDRAYTESTGVGTILAIDFSDPQKREFPDSPRFSCWKVTERGESASEVVASDEFEKVLTKLLEWRIEDLEARQAYMKARRGTTTVEEVDRQDADLSEYLKALAEQRDRLMRRMPTLGGIH